MYGSVYNNRILIPVHDEYGKYIWTEGRAIKSNIKNRYYRPFGVNRNSILFNMHRIKDFDCVIVVEGIIDCMMLCFEGINSVCMFGANLSDDQILLLTKFKKVYLCFDNDEAGHKGFFKAKEKISSIGIEFYKINMPYKKDINNIGVNAFKKKFNKSILITQ